MKKILFCICLLISVIFVSSCCPSSNTHVDDFIIVSSVGLRPANESNHSQKYVITFKDEYGFSCLYTNMVYQVGDTLNK